MERKNRKKRSIGNSMLSLMLVLALVISNIQIMPGTVSAVWASESPKTQSTDISDETSEAADTDNEQEDIENSAGGLEEAATETSAFRESESAATDDDSKTEISETETSETATETDTNELESEENTKTEAVTEAVETETVEEETATEESDGKLLNEEEESGSDDSKIGEQVTITVHFKNSKNWSQVAAFYGNKDGENPDWEMLCKNPDWPGDVISKDEDGYYTLEVKKDADKELALVFNNNDTENELKTTDIIVDRAFFIGNDTYEFWVWIDDNNNTVTYKSPEVKGGTVTFRYKNAGANDVHVLGLNDDWNASDTNLMKKNEVTGMHTFTTELEHGIYAYKFNWELNNWQADPENPFKVDNGDNSEFYVPGANLYTYKIHYYNPNAESGKMPDLHIWDKGIEKSWAYPAASKDRTFDSSKEDAEGRKWWTATFTVPYQHLGFMGRVNAGSYTQGQDDDNREYKLESGNEVELWYVHGTGENSGVHTENPFPVQEGLNPPELTIAKGTTTTLPAKLTKAAQDGTAAEVDVTYTMETEVDGVTLDDTKKQLTIAEDFAGTSVELTATETGGLATVTFEIKVVEDKNKITIKLHYNRPDGDYENWNVWAWSDGMEGLDGARYDFKQENNETVATIILDGRKSIEFGYIVRKSVEGNEWAEKDPNKELNRYIDLSTILSGTIDCYVDSGKDEVSEVLGEDILTGVKISSVEYDKETNNIQIITGSPIDKDSDTAFKIKCADGSEVGIRSVTPATNKKEFTIEPEEDLSSLTARVKKYFISFDGYDYNLNP